MFKFFYLFIALMFVACVSNDVDSVKEDSIGNFYLGLSELEVKKNVQCPVKLGKDEFWGADGLYHQDWTYADCGIVFDMTSGEKNVKKVVKSITITAPSKLLTNEGIGIGSTEKEVMVAYKSRWNKGESRDDMFVVDSVFGAILFSIKDGKVSNVFVGASAE